MTRVHERMPVIIQPWDEAFWLDTSIDAAPVREALLKPPPDDIAFAHTLRSVKRPHDDDATLIGPIDTAE
jgi:putative SOS response-associated peptidase YedK